MKKFFWTLTNLKHNFVNCKSTAVTTGPLFLPQQKLFWLAVFSSNYCFSDFNATSFHIFFNFWNRFLYFGLLSKFYQIILILIDPIYLWKTFIGSFFLPSRTFLLNFWFLSVFVVVFIRNDLLWGLIDELWTTNIFVFSLRLNLAYLLAFIEGFWI